MLETNYMKMVCINHIKATRKGSKSRTVSPKPSLFAHIKDKGR